MCSVVVPMSRKDGETWGIPAGSGCLGIQSPVPAGVVRCLGAAMARFRAQPRAEGFGARWKEFASKWGLAPSL